jgi:hypothetical protein
MTNIKHLCTQQGIPVEIEVTKIQHGWEGSTKGILQVLWERGFIDEKNLKHYTVDGRKDAFGNLQPHTSLKYLLGNCTDFKEEESMLQSIGSALGVSIDQTPKCHCELAGEGIEYSWGCAKNAYRLMPLSIKRKKETFWETVRKCLRQDVLTTEWVRKFLQRAHEYICAYHALHQGISSAEPMDTTSAGDEVATLVKIEKLVKAFKTHRCALDFDKGFITAKDIVIE